MNDYLLITWCDKSCETLTLIIQTSLTVALSLEFQNQIGNFSHIIFFSGKAFISNSSQPKVIMYSAGEYFNIS